MLAFWSIFDRFAFHLAVLGALSLMIAIALFSLSRWAFWVGLATFPIFFVEFVYALIASVNFVGWNPDILTALFNASLVVYLMFLVFSLLLLIDKRNTLRSVSIPFLKLPSASSDKKGEKTQKPSEK